MSYTVDYAVHKYKQSYFNFYGRFPFVSTNVGWIRVNNGNVSFRPSELIEMAEKLDERAMREGKQHLESDDKLSGNVQEINRLQSVLKAKVQEINLRKSMNKSLKARIEQLENMIRVKDQKIKDIKNNSVVFSMDDI